MEAVAKVHGLKLYHLCCFKGESLRALLPVYERSRLGLRLLVCPPLAYYQPLTFFPDPETRGIEQDQLQIICGLADHISKTWSRIRFNLDPGTLDARGFSWAGLKASPLYTYIWSADKPLHPNRNEQRKLKNARMQDYAYNEEFAPVAFVALLKKLYDRKQHPRSFSDEALLRFMHTLHSCGLLHQCNLQREGRIVSSNLVFGTGSGTAYAVLGATDKEDMKKGASSLQTVEMLNALKDRYSTVDLCGGNVPEVGQFKASLGLELKCFFRIAGRTGLL